MDFYNVNIPDHPLLGQVVKVERHEYGDPATRIRYADNEATALWVTMADGREILLQPTGWETEGINWQ
jgi:hypothetical protein